MKQRNEKIIEKLKNKNKKATSTLSETNKFSATRKPIPDQVLISDIRNLMSIKNNTLKTLVENSFYSLMLSFGIAVAFSIVFFYYFLDTELEEVYDVVFFITFLIFINLIPKVILNYKVNKILDDDKTDDTTKLIKINEPSYFSGISFITIKVFYYLSMIIFGLAMIDVILTASYWEGFLIGIITYNVWSNLGLLLGKEESSDWTPILIYFFAAGLNIFFIDNFDLNSDDFEETSFYQPFLDKFKSQESINEELLYNSIKESQYKTDINPAIDDISTNLSISYDEIYRNQIMQEYFDKNRK